MTPLLIPIPPAILAQPPSGPLPLWVQYIQLAIYVGCLIVPGWIIVNKWRLWLRRHAAPWPTAAGWSHGHNYVELARLVMRQTVDAIQGIEQRGALGTITVVRPEPLPDSPGWYRMAIDVQFYCEPAPDATADSAST